MSLRIYRGAIDSGMTGGCIGEMRQQKEYKHIVIIPEHYSYEMERLMVSEFGVIGINNIRVYTPGRLALNVLDMDTSRYLTAAGKQMLAVRAVKESLCAEDITDGEKRLMKQRSFAGSMIALISELKRRSVTPQMLNDAAAELDTESCEGEHLADKLRASARMYGRYEELLRAGNYFDADDDLERLAERIGIGESEIDSNTRVWLMRFDEYLPHHIRFIRALASRADTVTVCLNYVRPEESDPAKENDDDIYMTAQHSYRRLKELGGSGAEEVFFPHTDNEARERDIDFLVRRFGALESYEYGENESANIEIIECPDPHTEVEYIAEKIHTLIRESREAHDERMRELDAAVRAHKSKKPYPYTDEDRALMAGEDLLRYRDIGIIFGSEDMYTHILDAVFTEHKIPYFADEKLILSEHPIAVQLLSVFDIYESDWSHDAVFRYLNAGFVFIRKEDGLKRLDANDVSRLDSYARRYDIRGSRAWLERENGRLKPWNYRGEVFGAAWGDEERRFAAEERNTELVNRTRCEVCPALGALLPRDADEPKSVSEHTAAMIRFLGEINMYEGLEADVRRFEEASQPGTAQQFSQIWNGIIDVIEQINVTMGDMAVTFEEFGEYLRAGLSRCEIRTIPSALDAVYTGTVERSTSAPVKYLFTAGAVSGTYPAAVSINGYFSDADRELIGASVDLAPTKDEQRSSQRYKVFKAVRAAENALYVTYPVRDSLGAQCRRSGFAADIADMFGIREHSAFPEDPLDERNITSEYAAKRGLLINCASPVNKLPPVWQSVYRCLRDSGRHYGALEQIGRAASFYSHSPAISKETAQLLYSENVGGSEGRVYSATKLDAYSDCPMKYFMRFGLRLAEEEQSGIQANEVGTYVHRLVQTVCARVPELYGGADSAEDIREAWHSIDEDGIKRIISETVERTRKNLPEDAADYNMRLRVMDRIEDSVKRSAVNVLNSLKSGSFVLKDTELRLDRVRLGDGIYIKGFVDRVDEYSDDDYGEYLRVIDYKTGRQDFNEKDIINGRNMQLMVYAIAAQLYYKEETGRDYSLSGVYYQHMRDRFISVKPGEDDGGAVRKELYLDGVTYLPEDGERRSAVFGAMGNDPPYIGITLNKDGTPAARSYKKESERDALVDKVKENIAGIDREIMDGRIFPRPYRSGSSQACDFCAYKDICSFEKSKSVRFAEADGAKFGKEQ